MRRSNPHMHLLEAFLAWYDTTGDVCHLNRAERIVTLFLERFFDLETWSVGEFFDGSWSPAQDEAGLWREPGHCFEWAALLAEFALRAHRDDLSIMAFRLYAFAAARGINRYTGLAYGAVAADGRVLDKISRCWPQAEAIKATIALDRANGPALGCEVEARVGRLFRWHLDIAPAGLWVDRIDERGYPRATEVPASILYHLTSALTRYLDHTGAFGLADEEFGIQERAAKADLVSG